MLSIARVLLPFLVSSTALTFAAIYVANYSSLRSVWTTVESLPWHTNAAVFCLFVIATLLASLRLWLIARDIGSPITGRDAVIALTAGSLAGTFLLQLVGQLIVRSTFLARRGTPVAATLIMSGYERAAAAFVSLVFALAGASFLFGTLRLDLHQGGAQFLKLLGVGLFAVCCGAYLAWGGFIASRLPRIWSSASLGRGARSLAISAVIQLCTLSAYLLVADRLAPDLSLIDIAAASAIVMLAASLPISLAGWGIRELSSVLALGVIGMPGETALVVGLLIGTLSLAAFAFVLVVAFAPGTSRAQNPPRAQTFERPDFATALAWILPLATATAVFFQTYIPTAQGTTLNINLADPLAITAGTLLVLNAIAQRGWPDWHLLGLNGDAIAVTLVMMVGLVIGWASFGWTAWAFTSKFLGWFVLLSYAATGALLVARAGEIGRSALLRTFAAAGAAVAIVEIGLVALKKLGFPIWESLSPIRTSGMAVNPNAFALQMILVSCATFVAFRSRRLTAVLLAIALVALWLSASRAGLVAMIAVYAAGVFLIPHLRRTMAFGFLLAVAVLVLLQLSALQLSAWIPAWPLLEVEGTVPTAAGPILPPQVNVGPLVIDSTFSDLERWQTVLGGLSLFVEHPLFGAGLGAFAENWRQLHGHVDVIHSTPLWLLAEFGLVGALIIALPFFRIMAAAMRPAAHGEEAAILTVLCCLGFAVMALAHEMLYQRPFWLLLGASLALSARAIPWQYHLHKAAKDSVSPSAHLPALGQA